MAPRKATVPLLKSFQSPSNYSRFEVGIDEAGRGPMFGRVYVAAVVLPLSEEEFPHNLMKDSKKFSNHDHLNEVAEIIIDQAICYSVKYAEHTEIDENNILAVTMSLMRDCASDIANKMSWKNFDEYLLLVDGNRYNARCKVNSGTDEVEREEYICIEGGDNKYTSIAAASILAKYHRDKYIFDLCNEYDELDKRYGMSKCKGYGTAKHLEGLKQYGRSQWHRKTFGLCKHVELNPI